VARKVLFIVNDPVAPEAMLGETFAEQGFDIDRFVVVPPGRTDDPAFEVSFPDPTGYDVIVPLGARWSVYDEALGRTWVRSEMAMVRDADTAGVGVLGVCFGGQLLARAHGGSVTRSAAPEIGWFEIDSSATDLVPAGHWFEWHFDRWTLPPGATEIARNRRASQAFVIGHTLALQFHPELDATLLELWLDDEKDGELAGQGTTPTELRSSTTALTDDAARRLRGLVAGFLSHVARPPAAGEG
jgi:GMP synthase-like glutamine amidotransferase